MNAAIRNSILCSVCLFAGAETPGLRYSIEKPLTPGGRVELRLASGNYEIVPGSTDRIVVSWNDPSWKKPKVHLEAQGNTADLQVSHTPNGNFQVRIEVPAHCDLRARLTAGALKVGAVKGSKDIESRVGEIQITGEPADYAAVEGSVGVGELTAKAFNERQGGFFRSFQWTGTGQHRLHAHTGIGSITVQ